MPKKKTEPETFCATCPICYNEYDFRTQFAATAQQRKFDYRLKRELAPPPKPDPLFARELDTILAALRYWQDRNQPNRAERDADREAIATEHGPALDAEEIDSLCERLNLGAVTLQAPSELVTTCHKLIEWLYAIRATHESLVIETAPEGVNLCAALGLLQREPAPKPAPQLPKRLRVKPEPTYKPNPHLPEKKGSPWRRKPTKANNLYSIAARVVASEGSDVFQTGTIYARAANRKAARRLAHDHVDSTWPTADPRVDYRIELTEVERLSDEEMCREDFNRPEMVWTELEKGRN